MSRESVVVIKEGKQKDIRPCIESIKVNTKDNAVMIEIVLVDHDQQKPRVQDVLSQLFTVTAEETHLFGILRTGLYCEEKGQWLLPISL